MSDQPSRSGAPRRGRVAGIPARGRAHATPRRPREPVDGDVVLRMHGQGSSMAEIARKLGCSRITVARRLHEHGIGGHGHRSWRSTSRRHGQALYILWRYLRQRCEDPNHRDWQGYGGRGVRFGRDWSDFDAFYDWSIAHGYRPGLRLVRIEDRRGYEPHNCRWAPAKEVHQRRVGTPRRLVAAFGEELGLAEWARDSRCRVRFHTLKWRLLEGWPPEEAIASPPRSSPTRRLRPPRAGGRKPPAVIDWELARELYEKDGLSEVELAERLGASRTAIDRGLERSGVRRRRRSTAATMTLEGKRLYDLWASLRERCANPRHPLYAENGGRGIGVCAAWSTFPPFLEWARSSGTRKGLWLARKDLGGDWSPQNCAWITAAQRMARKRAPIRGTPWTRLVTAFGETKGVSAWAEDPRCLVTAGGLSDRLDKAWPVEQAITEPPRNPGGSGMRYTLLKAFGQELSKAEWLRHPRCGGITKPGLDHRLRQGWSVEDAIATPPFAGRP